MGSSASAVGEPCFVEGANLRARGGGKAQRGIRIQTLQLLREDITDRRSLQIPGTSGTVFLALPEGQDGREPAIRGGQDANAF